MYTTGYKGRKENVDRTGPYPHSATKIERKGLFAPLVVRDKRSNKTKGYGFVSFRDPADFTKAIKVSNQSWQHPLGSWCF